MVEISNRWAPVVLLVLLPGCLFAQSRAPDFRTRFEQETDAMRRAQMMPKLGEAEFAEITKDFDAEKPFEALAVLKEYNDEIQSCEKGLDERHIDAEKHPKGYKQLEISLRQALRKLNNLLVSFSADEQAPFLEVSKDMENLNRHLIHELFPKSPNDDSTPPD